VNRNREVAPASQGQSDHGEGLNSHRYPITLHRRPAFQEAVVRWDLEDACRVSGVRVRDAVVERGSWIEAVKRADIEEDG